MKRALVALSLALALTLHGQTTTEKAAGLLAKQEYAQALALFERAVTEGDASAATFASLGAAAIGAGKYERALEAYREAASKGLPPNHAAFGEARALLKLDRAADALAALERIKPPSPPVLNALRTSKDFDTIRTEARFLAVVQKLTPCTAPEHRQFDFWLGSWEVRSAARQLLGRNRISKRHGGCVLFEEWESAGGGTGSSFSFYDENTKQWHQFWVDASGTNWLSSDKDGNPTTLRGGIRDGAMLMFSNPDSLPSIGATRVTWKPLPDGRVRQTFDSSSDGGKTWSTSFDGFYSKIAE